jgi:cytochrome c5
VVYKAVCSMCHGSALGDDEVAADFKYMANEVGTGF